MMPTPSARCRCRNWELARDRDHTETWAAQFLDAFGCGALSFGTAEGFTLRLGARQAGMNALDNHRALEFGKDRKHLQKGAAGWRG